MRKDSINSMTSSGNYIPLNSGLRHPLVFSQTNIPPYMPRTSKDKSREKSKDNRSRDNRVISYQDLSKSIRVSSYNQVETPNNKEVKKYDFK